MYDTDDYVPMERFYHVTEPSNRQSIKKHGIKASEGMIFLFDNPLCASAIAINQCFMKEYALFEVKKSGITSQFVPDNVAEMTAKYQYYVEQERIEPQHLQFIDCYKIDVEEFYRDYDEKRSKYLQYLADNFKNLIED